MNELTLHAFLLTLIAGLSTGIGSCIALLARRTNRKFLSISLGFSAGVMVYVSMVEILSSAQSTLAGAAGERAGGWLTAAGFFGGILLIALIDRLVPSEENPHEVRRVERENTPPAKLMRMGALTAMAIALHNFPEGLATFVSALQEPGVAIPSWPPSPSTTFPRASPSPCPSIRPPARASRRFAIRSSPASPNRSAR